MNIDFIDAIGIFFVGFGTKIVNRRTEKRVLVLEYRIINKEVESAASSTIMKDAKSSASRIENVC